MNKYFISFVFNSDYGTGFGNCILDNINDIHSYDDILMIEKQIQLHEKLKQLPTIISYSKVYDE